MVDASVNKPLKYKIYPPASEGDAIQTISKNWLHIYTLKSQYKFSQAYVDNIDKLRLEYCGWRKIRGDGNCYYRAVITSYILAICHPKKDSYHIYNFLSLLNSVPISYSVYYQNSINRVIKLFQTIFENRNTLQEKVAQFQLINHKLQETEFDLDLISVARMVSCYSITVYHDSISEFLLEDEEPFLINKIMSNGEEAEGIELILCPLGLNIIVKQVNLFSSLLWNTFPFETQDNVVNNKIVVFIISKSKGHYDMLYRIQDMEEQEFCMRKGYYYIHN